MAFIVENVFDILKNDRVQKQLRVIKESAITLTIEEKFSPFYAKINAIMSGLIVTIEALCN